MLDEFRDLLARHVSTTAIDGVRICRTTSAAPPQGQMSGTALAVIAHGAKRVAVGERLHDYEAGQYLVSSVDMPVVGHALGPAPAFGLTLDPLVVAELLTSQPETSEPPGVAVGDAPAELLDAVVRLLRLLDRPRDRKTLAPLVKREIHWRLLTGEHGGVVRRLSHPTPVTRAVRWIRENYAQPIRVAEMARMAGMSVPTFHRDFHAVTAMSPIQFQKQLRLRSARLLLADRALDVTGVGYRVGYGSPSQFSQDYRRLFGAPPSRDRASG
jgi:AraC-like DNA-binding protein